MDENNYQKIFNYFGYDAQRRKLTEEVQEFNDAVLLYEKGKGDIKDVIEEISDIFNVLNGFITDYEITQDDIAPVMNRKLNRTIKRIRSGYYEKREDTDDEGRTTNNTK